MIFDSVNNDMNQDLILEMSARLDREGYSQYADIFFKHAIKSAAVKQAGIRLADLDGIDKEIISAKHMKDGFEIRKEMWKATWDKSTPPVEIETVYNHHGDYIGDKREAKLFIEKGIIPEKSKEDHSVCSIGYCPKDGKWYGWSHRAMKGFGIGDYAETFTPVKSTKSKEKIKTLSEALEAARAFAESVS